MAAASAPDPYAALRPLGAAFEASGGPTATAASAPSSRGRRRAAAGRRRGGGSTRRGRWRSPRRWCAGSWPRGAARPKRAARDPTPARRAARRRPTCCWSTPGDLHDCGRPGDIMVRHHRVQAARRPQRCTSRRPSTCSTATSPPSRWAPRRPRRSWPRCSPAPWPPPGAASRSTATAAGTTAPPTGCACGRRRSMSQGTPQRRLRGFFGRLKVEFFTALARGLRRFAAELG